MTEQLTLVFRSQCTSHLLANYLGIGFKRMLGDPDHLNYGNCFLSGLPASVPSLILLDLPLIIRMIYLKKTISFSSFPSQNKISNQLM